ncbi:MAG TPA: hypothetical protein PLY87_28770, partial [Planctomycetaceae bacterium]|nr:hypothetical protein [Planctomycetaceae bacterium]
FARWLSVLVSMFTALVLSGAPAKTLPALNPPACRKEDAAPRLTEKSERQTTQQVSAAPVSVRDLESLSVMTRGDIALRERLIDCAARKNPSGGRGWAVSKAEYDLWRDTR